ncbi:MAG: hypothetical protein NTZ90_09760 [Proteobacteria bacterium]|nr:hypothetical protein [Pseudomonadota bacterium]
MGATANEHRVELIVDGDIFWSKVRSICDNDELLWLGLQPFNMVGGFTWSDGPSLLEFCAAHSEYHIVTYTSENRYVNRYIPGQRIYRLATGDDNPYLVYNPWVDPLRPLIQEDVFGQLGCEAHEVGQGCRPKT